MKEGKTLPGIQVGRTENRESLAPLLESRASTLLKWQTTIASGKTMLSNSALLTDAYSSPLRAQHSAAKRGR